MTVCRMDRLMINQNVRKVVTLLVLLIAHVCTTASGSCHNESISIGGRGGGGLLVPVEPTKHGIYSYGSGEGEGGRWGRRLAPFQLCQQCKCCAASGDPSTCVNLPCCFGIDCQLPDKPFGVCAFVPKSCNCTSCAT